MRTLARASILVLIVTSIASLATAASATRGKPPDLAKSYLFTPAGKLTPLHAGLTYQASQFPLALRLTAGEPGWSGTQWRSGSDYFRGGGPPHFGWVHIGQGPPSGIPRGLITIMTAYARTPSVAATVNVLRTRGHGAAYEATSPVEVAGFRGIQFDGQIVGATNQDHIGHFFVPFSQRSHAAGYFPDEYGVYGDVFRVIVLNVRGKTIVIFIENVALPTQQFPTFLNKADHILESLRFPG